MKEFGLDGEMTMEVGQVWKRVDDCDSNSLTSFHD
jgi:hypothetical protein